MKYTCTAMKKATKARIFAFEAPLRYVKPDVTILQLEIQENAFLKREFYIKW